MKIKMNMKMKNINENYLSRSGSRQGYNYSKY